MEMEINYHKIAINCFGGALIIIPHIYLHSLHLINPLYIPTQPTSH